MEKGVQEAIYADIFNSREKMKVFVPHVRVARKTITSQNKIWMLEDRCRIQRKASRNHTIGFITPVQIQHFLWPWGRKQSNRWNVLIYLFLLIQQISLHLRPQIHFALLKSVSPWCCTHHHLTPRPFSPLSLFYPSAAATWTSHFSVTPSTSPPTNTYNHLCLPPAHSRVKCMGFLSQNMWRELIGSSIRLFPPDCFCVAVTCSPPHHHHHHLRLFFNSSLHPFPSHSFSCWLSVHSRFLLHFLLLSLSFLSVSWPPQARCRSWRTFVLCLMRRDKGSCSSWCMYKRREDEKSEDD